MRLTSDLILRSPVFINTVNEREIDLRGNKLPVIENLGATQDEYEAIDLSDNELVSFSNFPLLKRLRTVFASNNRLTHVAPGLGKALPGLEVLMLNNNGLATLADVAALGELARLTHLSLVGNPVAAVPHYRAFVIHKCAALEALDFTRVKRKERYLASKFFLQDAEGQALLAAVAAATGGAAPGAAAAAAAAHGATKRQKIDTQRDAEAEAVRARIRNAIMQAESIDDLAKLQSALREQNHTEAFLQQLEAIERDIANKK